jgi:hypothetical protein
LADIYYLIKFSFKKDLKKVVLDKNNTIISYKNYVKMSKFSHTLKRRGIKVVYAREFLKKFRDDLEINDKI